MCCVFHCVHFLICKQVYVHVIYAIFCVVVLSCFVRILFICGVCCVASCVLCKVKKICEYMVCAVYCIVHVL